MKYYNILFFRLYKLINKTNKSIPEWSTIIALSLLLIFNFISISLAFNYPLKEIVSGGRLQLMFVIIMGLNYFLFLKKDRYEIIIKELEKRKKSLIENLMFFIYLIGSILLFFLLMKYYK